MCQFETGMLSLVFWDVPLTMVEVLGVICLQARTMQVIEVDEN